ncbi:MAG: 2-oxoacid:acceptor oxidoreductase family protein [Candidatus Auribacterota bacterium]|jgi:2-oxoglutarate ferredoxin oxidoreductase subunit gamma|nr:2-oxoacid:acceptor oxidoreductase family protein [Candidatus Auribacterota bacterium]
MEYDLMIAGSGGQGILACGKIFAYAGMNENLQVTYYPSYGAEVRGGTTRCGVRYSDVTIASPIVDSADALIVFNEPSLRKYISYLKHGGMLVCNSSLVHKLPHNGTYTVHQVPATDIAIELGNEKVCNMVMSGFFLNLMPRISKQSLLKAMDEVFDDIKPALKQLNQSAMEKGMEYAG